MAYHSHSQVISATYNRYYYKIFPVYILTSSSMYSENFHCYLQNYNLILKNFVKILIHKK